MTTPPSLTSQYPGLTELGRRPEGMWYSAQAMGGLSVSLIAVSPAISARLADFDAFSSELARAATLQADGVARPVSWGKHDDGTIYCTFVGDEELATVATGVKPPSEVAAVGVQLARSLSAIHQAGMIHGAVSPLRIFRAKDGGVELSALGLHAAFSAGGFGVNAAAMLMSDLAYLSPEVRAAAPMDPRSDVYSLGAVLYEFITGKPPFGGRTTSYVMASVLSEGDGADSNTVDPVVDAVLRAIERSPDDRWPTAAAFAKALADGAGISPEPKDRSLLSILKGAWFPARRSQEKS